LTVTATLDWQGGGMLGSGATTVAAGGLLTISDQGRLERTLHNAGPAAWSSGRELDGSGLFHNQGSFTASADAVWFPNFATAGAFLKTGARSSFFHSFDNTGTVDVEAGTLGVTSGTWSGPATVGTGGRLLTDGDFSTLTITGSLGGGGDVEFDSPAATSGSYAIPG